MPNLNEFKENQVLNSQQSDAVKTGLDLLTPPTEIAKLLETIDLALPKRNQTQRPIVDFGESVN